ncbi:MULTISPECIES: hemin uptake protein HemP [unclassified Bradyrhizobium]
MTDKPPHGGGLLAVQFSPPAPRTISSRDLLQGERLLIIRHDEEIYRLQLTAAGKLILTK